MHARLRKEEPRTSTQKPRVRIVKEDGNVPSILYAKESTHHFIQASEEIAAHDRKVFVAIFSFFVIILLGMIFLGV